MKTKEFLETARGMVADGKGLLAMDESPPTCDKRFAKLGIPLTEECRREYREMILTTSGLEQYISGVILHEETLGQKTREGVPFLGILAEKGIIAGIKVDAGAKDLAGHPGEKVTEGLDGLRERLARYRGSGMRFAKWRAVFSIGDGLPSGCCIEVNAHALARYAALTQEAGLVPVVEPEVLMDGTHSLPACADATDRVLMEVFNQLHRQGVVLEGIILKPNMVLAGLECDHQPPARLVAEATVEVLLRNVPAAVPGIAFLSGGQTAELASERLNAISVLAAGRAPWALSFSFARAIQQPALEIWRGQPVNMMRARKALRHRAACNQAARMGCYDIEMEISGD